MAKGTVFHCCLAACGAGAWAGCGDLGIARVGTGFRASRDREKKPNKRKKSEGPPGSFSYVWQTKDFKSFVFVSVASKGLTGAFLVCVARKGLRRNWRLRRDGREVEEVRLARLSQGNTRHITTTVTKKSREIGGAAEILSKSRFDNSRSVLILVDGPDRA